MEWPSYEERKQIYDLQAQIAKIVIGNDRLVGMAVEDAKRACELFGFHGIDVKVPVGYDLVGISCHVPHIVLYTNNGVVVRATHNG